MDNSQCILGPGLQTLVELYFFSTQKLLTVLEMYGVMATLFSTIQVKNSFFI